MTLRATRVHCLLPGPGNPAPVLSKGCGSSLRGAGQPCPAQHHHTNIALGFLGLLGVQVHSGMFWGPH